MVKRIEPSDFLASQLLSATALLLNRELMSGGAMG